MNGVTRRVSIGGLVAALLASTNAVAMRTSAGLGALVTPQDLGAKCDGTTDDTAALLAASAAVKPIVHRAGVLRIASSAILAAPLDVTAGALILVDGATLTLAGPFSAPGLTCFTSVNGGKIKLADGVVEQIDPRWWGLSTTAPEAVNVAAIRAAHDSPVLRGVIAFPPGAFAVNAFVGITRDYIRYVGAGTFRTVLVNTSNTADTTGIDGSAAGAYLVETSHIGIGTFRPMSLSATVTVDSDGLPNVLPAGPKGFRLTRTVFAEVDVHCRNDPIGYYEAQNTSARVKVRSDRETLSGDTSATKWVGFVSDCAAPAAAGTSANGSVYRTYDANAGSFTGEGWGGVVYGSDHRDHFNERIEIGPMTHAWDVVATGSNIRVWDNRYDMLVADSWHVSGVRIKGLPPGSSLSILAGWSCPDEASSSTRPCLEVINSVGVSTGYDFEFNGGVDYAQEIGVALTNSSRCDIRGRGAALNKGVVLVNSALNSVSVRFDVAMGHTADSGIAILGAGSVRNRVRGCDIDGMDAGSIVYGVFIDGVARTNTIEPCNINPDAVLNPVYIAGSRQTAPGTFNHNHILPGSIDVGL